MQPLRCIITLQFHLWYFLSWEIHIKFYSNLDLHKLDPRLVHRKGCCKNYLELNFGIFIEWSDETKILFLPDYEFGVCESIKVVCCSIYTVPTGVHMYKCAITAENWTKNELERTFPKSYEISLTINAWNAFMK